MSKVQLLPQNLINQIAAGEVVERPASVIKELVENSLDAGATMIEVSLKRAGREMISITDNGCGMSPEDARMSLERHATSKIHSFDDLMRVGTMGFRGEALPSIASIAYLTLKTFSGRSEGLAIRVEGGKKMSEEPYLTQQGTTITVEHLFYNVPARRKFLKSDATEMGQCVETLKAIALGNPGVGFKLWEGRRVIIDLPSKQSREERLEKLWGTSECEGLLEINANEGETRLEGLLSPIGKTFSTRQKICFFVNRRPVDVKIFHMALREVYGSGLTRGHYPAACVYLTIPSGEVDINVHPAKREIRFRAEREKLAFLINALGQTLKINVCRDVSNPVNSVSPFENTPNGLPHFAFTSPTIFTPTNEPFDVAVTAIPFPVDGHIGSHPLPPPAGSREEDRWRANIPESAHQPSASQTIMRVAEAAASRHGWKFLSFLHKEYALFSTPEGLVILSINNAQERVGYEKIEAALERPHSQTLIMPALLQLDGTLEETLKINKKIIAGQGFVIEPFGKGAYRLEGIPSWLAPENGFHGAPENLLVEELATLSEDAIAHSDERLKHQTVLRLAAKHSRTTVSHASAVLKLVDELLFCRNPLRAPCGTPTFWQINLEEMVKRFLR